MPKVIPPLSENEINIAKPRHKTYWLFDGGGLYIMFTPSGGKLWRFKYRFEGKEKLMSFGAYPGISLDDARYCRDAAREQLAQHLDPATLRKEEKAREKADRLETKNHISVRVTFDGRIEIWKGGNILRLTWDETRFIANLINNIVR